MPLPKIFVGDRVIISNNYYDNDIRNQIGTIVSLPKRRSKFYNDIGVSFDFPTKYKLNYFNMRYLQIIEGAKKELL
jgi:hypothetical protein